MWSRGEIAARPSPREGASFCRHASRWIVETVKVLAVVRDGAGVSHVQFDVEFTSPGRSESERRTLALDRFLSLYTEPADA